MNAHDYHSLFEALNSALDILHRNRTPDPAFVVALDNLKQSRALLEKAISPPLGIAEPVASQLAAA